MKKSSFIFFWIILALVLVLRLLFYFDNNAVYSEGQKVVLETTLIRDPKHNQYSQSFWIDDVRVVAKRLPQYHYGDNLIISGNITHVSFVDQETSKAVSYLEIKYPKITQKKSKNPIILLSEHIRMRFEGAIRPILPRDEKGLLLGIVFGVRYQISSEFSDGLLKTGLMHVIAASGANVILVGGFLTSLFRALVSRKKAILFSSLGIFIYAFIAGLDASIVRATVMALFAYTASFMGRSSSGIISLFFASFIMIFIHPKTLFDIGFQLSFFATAGIIMIKPIIDNFFSKKILSQIKDDFSTTISANIAVFPILSYHFGQVSVFAVFVNALLLWMVPIIMFLGGMGAIVSIISPVLAQPFIYISYPFLLLFVGVVKVFSDVSVMFNLGMSLSVVVIYIVFVYMLITFLKR